MEGPGVIGLSSRVLVFDRFNGEGWVISFSLLIS